MPVLSPILLLLANCSLGGQAVAPPQLDTARVPDVAALGAKIQEIFKTGKLTGYPRVSPARPAPVNAVADWVICLRSDADNDPRIYALLIQNNEIVDYRLALAIDGCEREQYGPLPLAK
jgi:hypothetical protein